MYRLINFWITLLVQRTKKSPFWCWILKKHFVFVFKLQIKHKELQNVISYHARNCNIYIVSIKLQIILERKKSFICFIKMSQYTLKSFSYYSHHYHLHHHFPSKISFFFLFSHRSSTLNITLTFISYSLKNKRFYNIHCK